MTTLAIETRALKKQFGDFVAVNGIDLAIPVGGCHGILGPNGAGKTTTLEMLEGLQKPSSGEIRILGRSWDKEATEIRTLMGVQLQETRFFDLSTVQETLELFRSFTRSGMTVQAAMDLVQLRPKRNALVQNLSGGQLQRLALATALVGDPQLIFLDEPTTGLDPHSRAAVWDVVKELKARGRTVVLTTHYMEEAETLCDDLYIFDAGKILVHGTPSQLIHRYGGTSILEVETSPRMQAEWLTSLPGVDTVLGIEAGFRLKVSNMAQAISAVVKEASTRGVSLDGVRTMQPTMNDVFLALTGRALRAEGPLAAQDGAA